MLELLTRNRLSAIALEFGACSLRAVQLARAGQGWQVHHWLNLEREPAGPHPDPPDYAAQMRLAFGPGSFTGRRTAMLLSPPEVEYKLLEIPPAVLARPRDEWRAALQFELDRQMPWPTAECELAVWPLTRDATSSLGDAERWSHVKGWPVHQQPTGSVMAVAARSAALQQRLDVLDGQRLDCLRAELVPNAMARLAQGHSSPTGVSSPVEHRGHHTGKDLYGILEVGFSSCRLYLLHGGQTIFARVVRGGGRELTEALAKALHVEFRIAEQYKRIYGIQRTERGFRALAGGLGRIDEAALPGVLYAVLRPTLEAMVGEIERSYRFAMGRLPGVTAGPIFLVGGGARLRGLVEALGASLGVPVCLPQPPPILRAVPGEHPLLRPAEFCVLAPCVGLAMMEDAA